MAEETDQGSITLSDPHNGPIVRWAATDIEVFTTGLPEGAGFSVKSTTSRDGRKLTLIIERNEKFDVIEDQNNGG